MLRLLEVGEVVYEDDYQVYCGEVTESNYDGREVTLGDYGTFFRKIKETKLDDLKCCGNCSNSETVDFVIKCDISGEKMEGYNYCNCWDFDGFEQEDRIDG